MNEELTNELLEAMVNCDGECIGCPAQSVCDAVGIKRSLATALLEERAKPKVWDKAPEWADRADVSYKGNVKGKINISVYTRELPKTRARQIIENPDCPFKSCQFWDDNADGKCGGELHGGSAQETCKWYTDYESALNKYAKELEGKE